MLELLPWLSAAAVALSSLVLWGFASGRWVQKREDADSDLRKLAKDLRTEDANIVAFKERVNTDLGRLELRMGADKELMTLRFQRSDERHQTLEERVENLERFARDLQRQIDQRHQ